MTTDLVLGAAGVRQVADLRSIDQVEDADACEGRGEDPTVLGIPSTPG